MTSGTVFPAGTRLARYATEAEIGRGGMSVVYAAYDHQLERLVALKVMAPPISDDARFRERFLRESRLAASIDHPNVIPIYDAGEVDGRLYIAMRLVQGTDLRGLLRREGPLEPARALAIVGQAASALDAAHARGLLHRDVKPANILLASDEGSSPHVYLSDFGLALPSGAGRLEQAGFHGTADYAAPEQIEGRPQPRSDLYALACVLFECLAGEPPFAGGRLLETLWRQLSEDPPRLGDRRPDWPETADDALAAGLAKDPGRRPATCAELVSSTRSAFGIDRPDRSRARVGALLAVLVAGGAAALALVLATRGQGGPQPRAQEAGSIVTLAGTGTSGSSGDGGPAVRAELAQPFAVTVDRAGNLYVSEGIGGRVRRIDRAGKIVTVAGPGEAVAADYPWDPARPDLGVDPAGRLYVLRINTPLLRRVVHPGTLTTVAGTGNAGYLNDGRHTFSADLCGQPSGPAFDARGRAYIACLSSNRVIRIDRRGAYTTVAGSGTAGYAGDGGPATKAALNAPRGIAVDRHGNLYISDFLNNRVRKVDAHGVITTFAGNGLPGFSADGWPASSVQLWQPTAIAVDASGDVYIVEAATNRVRKVDPHGVMTTIAGTGQAGFSGDGGPAGRADLQNPADVAVDARGNVYIADRGNNRIRQIKP
jgi:serine/threonine-protein kinase